MNINIKEVGKRIKIIRINLKATTAEFAEFFDPSASNSLVSRWERGVNLPNNERIKKIAELGNITVEELLYGDTYFRKLELIKQTVHKAHEHIDDIDKVSAYLTEIEKIIDTN